MGELADEQGEEAHVDGGGTEPGDGRCGGGEAGAVGEPSGEPPGGGQGDQGCPHRDGKDCRDQGEGDGGKT